MSTPTIGTLIDRACRAFPDRTAVVDGDRRLSFAELGDRIQRTGRALRATGLQRGDRVAILMENRWELLVVFHAAIWAGLAVVPLNEKQRIDDHVHISTDSGAKLLCHDEDHAAVAAEILDRVGRDRIAHVWCTDEAGVLEGGESLARVVDAQDPGPLDDVVTAEDRALIAYTGGTTGLPKGVELTNGNLYSSYVSEIVDHGLADRETFAHVAPMTHSSGIFSMPVWMRGGTNIALQGFDPEKLLDVIQRESVTALLAVPTMLYVLLDHPALQEADVSSLRTVVYGAAPMNLSRLEQAMDHFGPIFTQLYGQTEAPNQITALGKAAHADAVAPGGDASILSSAGIPTIISTVRLLDDDGNDVPDGEPGEIAVRGPHVMRGYWGLPDKTAETIVDGWLLTGDVARRDERGFHYIVDRKKDLIITGGFNVYPKEVEEALHAHPDVKDACVIGVPDDKWGEAVKASVVVADGAQVDPAALKAWVKDRKGSVMSPKQVELVDAIPLTAVGKHDRKALRAAAWEGRDRQVG